MKRQTFVKKLMARGIHRNAANWVARQHAVEPARALVEAAGCVQITNVLQARDGGAYFRVKVREEAQL